MMAEQVGGEDEGNPTISWCDQGGESAADVFPGDDAWDGMYSEGGNGSGRSRKCEGCG
jgi:hypothetical protein